MFNFSRRSRLLKQLRETIAYIHKRIRIDRDLLSDSEIRLLHTSADRAGMELGVRSNTEIERSITDLNEVFEKVFPSTPGRGWRENGEILLVAVLVAMAFRAYFLQPFRIPTGSMQPTLYGITSERREGAPPGRFARALHWFLGKRYVYVKAEQSGSLRGAVRMTGDGKYEMIPQIAPIQGAFSYFFPKTRFAVGNATYVVNASPQELVQMLKRVPFDHVYQEGEVILNEQIITGDHLFVDRFSYNFTRPKRGDIFVFETRDLPARVSGEFYIKRCVALPEERISIGDDDRIVIDGQKVPAEGPFARIYSKTNGYYGHLNFERLREIKQADHEPTPDPFAHLLKAGDEFQIPAHFYWAMGDNTRNSLDSRYVGPIPEGSLVGRAFFVYWPLGKRWGLPE